MEAAWTALLSTQATGAALMAVPLSRPHVLSMMRKYFERVGIDTRLLDGKIVHIAGACVHLCVWCPIQLWLCVGGRRAFVTALLRDDIVMSVHMCERERGTQQWGIAGDVFSFHCCCECIYHCVYPCVCVCACVCTCIRMHVYMYACVYVRAGTKGKGSTSAMCESILRHHGLTTGSFSLCVCVCVLPVIFAVNGG